MRSCRLGCTTAVDLKGRNLEEDVVKLLLQALDAETSRDRLIDLDRPNAKLRAQTTLPSSHCALGFAKKQNESAVKRRVLIEVDLKKTAVIYHVRFHGLAKVK